MIGATAAGITAMTASTGARASAESLTDPVKLVAVLRRRADLSPAQFYDYWLHQHGPLAVEQVKILGGVRYVQSHTTDANQNVLLANARGTAEAFDGLTEVWFPSTQAAIATLGTPAGWQANDRLSQDEKNFIDLGRSSFFLTTERVLLG